jgi:hypothetical protein
MKMYTGDLKPDLRITLSDPDTGFDASAATSVLIVGKRKGVQVFSRAPISIVVTGTGVGTESELTMEWQAGDTSVAGTIWIEIELVWPGNVPQTVKAENCGVEVFDA